MLTDKERLKQWIVGQKRYGKEYIKTSEVYSWGVKNFSNRAVRNMQDLCASGELVRRVPKSEAVLLGFTGREGVWKIEIKS